LAFLVFDLGTGSLRAGLVAPNGAIIVQTSVPIRDREPVPGRHEIEPELWWQALRRAAAQILDRAPQGTPIVAICIGGATRAQVFLDADGKPLGSAMLFRDRRAAQEAGEISPYFADDNPGAAITAFHPLARIAWLYHHEPALSARLYAVCEPKDYLNFRLTGRIACDSITYSRFDSLKPSRALPDWLQSCLDRLQLDRREPWAVLGPVACAERPFDRLRQLPVFVGSMDAWMAALGSGAVVPGQGYDIAGTSEVVGLVTEKRAAAPGLVSLRWTETSFHLGGPTQAGADSARWAHKTFRVRGRLADAVERAGAIAPRADEPLFLPYLAGERTPVWRADVRAAFHGIGLDHGPDDFLWATLEGVALAICDILDHATVASGETLLELRVSGGGAHSDAWCQLKADMLGVPVARAAQAEAGLSGAAIAAAVGSGVYPSIAAAAAAMTDIARVFAPRPALAGLFAERAKRYAAAKAMALGGMT
jgi:xylulokinase